jgi:hypothetical protein
MNRERESQTRIWDGHPKSAPQGKQPFLEKRTGPGPGLYAL